MESLNALFTTATTASLVIEPKELLKVCAEDQMDSDIPNGGDEIVKVDYNLFSYTPPLSHIRHSCAYQFILRTSSIYYDCQFPPLP